VRRPAVVAGAILAAATVVLAGCGGSAGDEPVTPGPPGTAGPQLTGSITVFAAASLTEAFEQLGETFQQANPSATVRFSFGSSSGLARQIQQGAPADVFASASGTNMQQVVDAKAAGAPRTFAQNTMQIAVPPSNPAGIATVADLARPAVKVALCAAEVPCGTVAREVFRKAGVSVTPVTEEVDVKATLSKVLLGEVDAGVVYVSDVKAAGGEVTGIPIPDDVNAGTSYPIATLTGSGNAVLAQAFVDHVLSAEGGAVLAAAGFDQA
jgi:molybdate transport system substrate-binding protein